ncbi:metagenomic prevalent protein [Mycobacterium phage Adawi]|uniref:Metagenomic prevalent protein n=1 Tax=Mycobacterium phage Adawi TaxID=1354507 RepID=T2A7Z9_9CAUD|nr:metagenomic prevalent protein [Mycobacterium phage Adawi]AGU91970.1 metagenomic prevalent protein [Mycobacterium phage Adawi]
MSGYRRRDILHSPGCEFLRPDGIACTCGSFEREVAAAKLARTATTTTTTEEPTMPDADGKPLTAACPNDSHSLGCHCHQGEAIQVDVPPLTGLSAREQYLDLRGELDPDTKAQRLKARDQAMADIAGKLSTTGTRARDICEHAADLVNNDRNAVYGDAEQNFTETGALWAVVFGHEVTAEQVALCMALVKVARLIKTPNHADSWTDGVGYLALGGGIASKPGRYV